MKTFQEFLVETDAAAIVQKGANPKPQTSAKAEDMAKVKDSPKKPVTGNKADDLKTTKESPITPQTSAKAEDMAKVKDSPKKPVTGNKAEDMAKVKDSPKKPVTDNKAKDMKNESQEQVDESKEKCKCGKDLEDGECSKCDKKNKQLGEGMDLAKLCGILN